jgi:phosphohistidine phosphatase
MDLFLWRHADAAGAEAEGDAVDMERPLTPKGERQAKRMAGWVNTFLPDSTRILVSPAVRAQQTAQALGRKFITKRELDPHCSAHCLLSLARWPDRQEPVMVVGHQPTLGQTAALLIGRAMVTLPQHSEAELWDGAPWTVRKGAVWWLRHQVKQGQSQVLLMSVRSPDQV